MRMTDAFSLYQALVAYESSDREFPSKLNFAVGVNRRKLMPLVEAYRESLRELINRCALRDANGGLIKVGDTDDIRIDLANQETWVVERAALDNDEVQMELHMVDLSVFPAAFPARLFAGLGPMIREPSTSVVPLRSVVDHGDGA